MSLRTKSRIPASTSEAARSESGSIASVFSERMAFMAWSPVFRVERVFRTTKVSGDIRAFDLDGIATNVRHCSFFQETRRTRPARLPAALESGRDGLVGEAERRFGDRAGDAD